MEYNLKKMKLTLIKAILDNKRRVEIEDVLFELLPSLPNENRALEAAKYADESIKVLLA